MLEEVVKREYQKAYGAIPSVVVRSPGRINLIGEHTDYNMGYVLPAAIDKSLYFAFGVNEGQKMSVRALDVNASSTVYLDDLAPREELWLNYLIGILREFRQEGITVSGFNCVFTGDIPIGSGLSSSAALDCGFITGLSQLMGHPLNGWDVVGMSNRSNNDFLGIKSGILDQFASVFGREGESVFLDCKSKQYTYHPLHLTPYEWVLINSNVKHEHASSGYNDRPAECQEVVDMLSTNLPNILSLRDVSIKELSDHKSLISSTLYKRAQFILEENKRVISFLSALEKRDNVTIGRLLYESHYGLQHLYEVSCPELDLLVDLTRHTAHVLGARMMGGGFGGCTLNLVHRDHSDQVIQEIMEQYREKTGVQPDCYKVRSAQGVSAAQVPAPLSA